MIATLLVFLLPGQPICETSSGSLALFSHAEDAPVLSPELCTRVSSLALGNAEVPIATIEERLGALFARADCATQNGRIECVTRAERLVEDVRVTGAPFPLLDKNLRARLAIGRGDAFTGAEVETHEQRIQGYLTSEGFFDAGVEISAEEVGWLGTDRLVDLTVVVSGGYRTALGTVTVEGDTVITEEEARDYLEHNWLPFVPQRFSPRQLRRDTERLQAVLRARGWPTTRVRSNYETVGEVANVTLRVDAGPRVRVEVDGNHALDDDDIRELAPFADAGAVDTVALNQFADKIRTAYQRECYHDASVTVARDSREDEVVLTVTVEEGEHRVVERIEIEGPVLLQVSDGVTLRLEEDGWIFDGCYVESWAAADDRALAQALAEAGYPEARVSHETHQEKRGLRVTFEAEPGPYHVLSFVEVSGAELSDRTREQLQAFEGQPFQSDTPDRIELLVRADLARSGFLQAEVTRKVSVSADGDEKSVGIELDAASGQQAYLAGLVLRGAFRTRRSVVIHELDVETGEPLNVQKIAAAEQNLRSLGPFRSAHMERVFSDEDGGTWLLARAEEKDPFLLDLVVSYSSDDRLQIGADFVDRNLLGRALRWTLSGRFGNAVRLGPQQLYFGNVDRLESSLAAPRFFGTAFSVRARALVEQERRRLFEELQMGGELTVRRPVLKRNTCAICPDVTAELGYQLESVDYRSVEGERRDDVIARVFTSLLARRTGSFVDPRQGYGAQLRVDLARPELALGRTDASYWKVALDGMLLVRTGVPLPLRDEANEVIGGPVVIAFDGTIARAHPMGGTRIPANEALAYGGQRSVRGLEERASLLAVPDARWLVRGTAELRWYVIDNMSWGSMQLAGFADTAMVDPRSLGSADHLTVTAGPIVRWITPVGPLSVAWGFPLRVDPDIGSDAAPPSGRLHLSFGGRF